MKKIINKSGLDVLINEVKFPQGSIVEFEDSIADQLLVEGSGYELVASSETKDLPKEEIE